MTDGPGRRPTWRTLTFGVLFVVAALLGPAAGAVTASSPAAHVLATGLQSRTLTPGATNPAVTQATINQTICVSGWTRTVRPPSSYTSGLKTRQLAIYGFADRHLADYEEDHLISLELGGSPRSSLNLWPEPRHIRLADGTDVGGYAKDALENYLKRQVCAGNLTLASAQHEIASNWVKYWRLMRAGGATSPTPTPTPAATPGPTPTPTPAPMGTDAIAAATVAGATAVCNDGSWSYSQTRSGTCSSHGGVFWWTGNLGPPGPG